MTMTWSNKGAAPNAGGRRLFGLVTKGVVVAKK
jgi:hypothetical protein